MKKIINLLLCSLLICGLVLPFSACNNKMTGETYGLVHNAGYVGKATITKSGDKITDATLEEMCLPTQVKATADVPEADRVDVVSGDPATTTYYYKTVKFNDVTMTYDMEKGYMVGNQTLKEYFQNEDNCKAYFEAAKGNNLIVMVGGQEKKDVMTNALLNKDENGYWTRQDANNNNYSRWKVNRDATVNYVKEYGVEGLKNLTQSTETVKDSYGVDAKYWKDANGVSTGATWSDMYKATNPTDYYTYSQLLLKAADKASSENK